MQNFGVRFITHLFMDAIKDKKAIIWDWNGTLLNDRHICVECMNVLLKDRGLELLTDDKYQEIFTFPVQEYYVAAGFDFTTEDFEIPAHQFIDLYRVGIRSATLHPEVPGILEHFKNRGMAQTILSAMEQNFLTGSIRDLGIQDYFTHIFGVNNHLAHSKSEVSMELIRELDMPVSDLVLIGDTLHDYEVALYAGIDCILVGNGHQSIKRLEKADCLVIDKITDLEDIL